MANNPGQSNGVPFTIRRLSPEEAERSRQGQRITPQQSVQTPIETPQVKVEPVSVAVQKKKGKQEQPTVPTARTGGCFASAGAVLAFLSAALGTGLINEAAVRQRPEGGWWAEVPVTDVRLAPLVWTSGGRPYGWFKQKWVGLTLSGEIPQKVQEQQTLDVATWPIVELGHLLARTTMKPRRYTGLKRMAVLVPGVLGRWVLSRAVALGLEVAIKSVTMAPLDGAEAESAGGLLLYISVSEKGTTIPAALVYSLTRMPYVIVADPCGSERLLVDVRGRAPLPVAILDTMVPHGQIWVLGPAETGSWRVCPTGEEVDGVLLLAAPEKPVTVMHLPGTGNLLPQGLPVQLMPCPTVRTRVDGVLLDDQELEWLRVFLPGQVATELFFLLPGNGVHLLVAPGGLPGTGIPFGIPLTRTGPGGLYVESGLDFYPPLPDSARMACFQLDESSATVVIGTGAYRFLQEHMVPAWVLWVGSTPEIQQDISSEGKKLLSFISERIRQAEAQRPEKTEPQATSKPVDRKERVRLLEQAQREELKGNLVKAAEYLEAAGYPGQAGRLYERATKR